MLSRYIAFLDKIIFRFEQVVLEITSFNQTPQLRCGKQVWTCSLNSCCIGVISTYLYIKINSLCKIKKNKTKIKKKKPGFGRKTGLKYS